MGKADRICGIAALLLAGLVFTSTSRLALYRVGVPGSRFLPLAIAIFIAACGLILILFPGRSQKEQPLWPQGKVRWQVAGSYLGLFLYFLLIPILGFLLMTAVFLALLMWWWGGQRSWVPWVFGAVGSALMFLVFRTLLDVPLPLGIWSP